MPLYEIEGPDKRTYTIEGPEGATLEQLVAVIKQQGLDLPPTAPRQSTVLGEAKRGLEQLVSGTVTGVGAITGSPEEAALSGLRRGERIATEAGEGPSFERIQRIFQEKGFLEAGKAALGDVPRIVAGQVPQLGAMAAGAKLGAMTGTAAAPFLGPAAPAGPVIGGGLGALATLAPSVYGQMIERQAAEQQARGEPIDIQQGRAAAATAGSLALEVGGTAAAAGKTLVKKVLGIAEDPALLARTSQEALVASANRSLAGYAGRGAVIEMPVGVAQAVMERAQAGLPVTGDEAFAEYGEAAYLEGVAGGALGGVGGVSSRGAARRGVAAEEARVAEAQRAGPPLPGAEFMGPPEPPPVQGTLFDGPRQTQVQDTPTVADRTRRELEEANALREETERLQREYNTLRDQVAADKDAGVRFVEREKRLADADAAVLEARAKAQELPTNIDSVRDQFDRLQRENQRLRSQYEQEADPAKKAAIFAEAERLAPQLRAMQDEYSHLRRVTPENAPGARRPQAPEGQLELPLTDEIRLQDLPNYGVPMEGGSPAVVGVRGWLRDNVLGKTPEQVRRMTEKQPDLLQGRGLRARVLKEIITPQPQPQAYQQPTEAPSEPRAEDRVAEQPELDLGGAEPSVGVPGEPTAVPTGVVEPAVQPEVTEPTGLGDVKPSAVGRAPEEGAERGALGGRVAATQWEDFKPEGAPTYDQLPLRAQSEWAKRATRPTGAVTMQDADDVFNDAVRDVGFQTYSFKEQNPKAEQMFADTTEGRVAKAFYDALPEQGKKLVEREQGKLAEQKRSGSAAVKRQEEAKRRKSEEEAEYDEAEKERQREEAKRKKAEEKEPPKSRKERRKAKFRVADKEVQGNPQAVVQQLVDKIIKGWKQSPNIVVVQSISDLPPDIISEVEEAKVNPKGAFSGGTVFVIADNATGYNDVMLTVAHEAIGHYGLRAVLGNKFNTTLENLYNTNDQVKVKADQKIAAGLPKLTAIEETLADAVEERIPPSSAMGRAMQTIKNLIRTFFRKLGVKTLNDSEVQMLLDASRDYVIEGKQPEVAPEPAEADTKVLFRAVEQTQQGFSPVPGGLNRITSDAVWEGILKLRTQLADKGAYVFDRIAKGFNDEVNTALKGKQVEAGFRQAEASDQFPAAFFRLGAMRKDRPTGKWEAYEDAQIKPPAKVLDYIREYAADNNMSFKEAYDYISDIMAAAREHAFREHNTNRSKGEAALPRNMPDDEVDRLYPIYQSNATIKNIVKTMDKVRFGLIDHLVDVGRIPAELGQEWKDATNYIPFDRLPKLGEKPRTPQKRTGRGIGQLGKLPELVDAELVSLPPKNTIDNYFGTIGWMARQVIQQDATLSTLRALENIGEAKLLQTRNLPRQMADRVATTYIKGEERYFEVASPYHKVAFNMMSAPTLPIFRVFQRFSQVLRHAITAVPTFTAAQLPQDIQRAIMYSGVQNPAALTAKVLANFKDFSKAAVLGKLANVAPELGTFGVVGGVDFHMSDPAKTFLTDMGVYKDKLLGSTKFATLLKRLEGIAMASDIAMRKAIYDQTLEETQGDRLQALTRAREIINFRRFGAGDKLGLLHLATQTVPFYNAYLQGTDVLFRSLTGKNAVSGLARNAALKHFYKNVGYLMAASTVYAMMMADEEDYENMDLRERDRTWVIGGGIGLPVPGELGVLFKAIPERVVEYYRKAGTPEEAVAMEAIIAHFKTGIASEYFGRAIPMPVAIKPLLEVWTNYSFLTGRELEGISQKQLDASERVTSRTSELAKSVAQFAAKSTNGFVQISPIAIDTVLQGYLGTAAGLTMAVADQALNPNRADRPLHQIVGATPFAYDPVGTRRSSEFYELREKVVQSQNTLNRLIKQDPERAAAYYERNAERLAIYKMVNSTLQQLEDSRKYKQWLDTEMAAETMSSEERMKMKQEVQAYEQKLVEWVRDAKNEMKL
jgi:hypothetical protein